MKKRGILRGYLKSDRLGMFFFLVLCLSLLPWLLPSSISAAPVSPPIQLDSWVYPALDKLSAFAQVNSDIKGMRPLSRHEAARRVLLLKQEWPQTDSMPVFLELIRALERELTDELSELADLEPTSGWKIKPMSEPRVSYIFRDGPESFFLGNNGRQFALEANREGRDSREQNNLEFSWISRARLGEHLLADWRPQLDLQEGRDARLRTTTVQLALAVGPVTLSAGRQSLWWGPGRHGSLLLTNNAKPLDMLRLNNPEPMSLPWLFGYLGPFQFDLFVSRLESERVIPNPNLAGLRVNFKPSGWLEFGAARTVMFGGRGTPALNIDDYLTILGGKNLEGGEETSNSIAAIDLQLKLPWPNGLQLYGELGGEDEAGHLPSKNAFILGFYLPRLTASGRLDLRIEYADTTPKNGKSAVWYRHGLYRSGYTYEQKIIGHHVGNDAQDLWMEMRTFLPGGLDLAVNFEFQQRGITQAVQEKHYQPGFDLRWRNQRAGELHFVYRYDHVKRFAFSDQSVDLQFAILDYTFHW